MSAEQWKRITIEGPVEDAGGGRFAVGKTGDWPNVINPLAPHVVSIVDIDPPERWQVGDVVLDANGGAFMRNSADSWGSFGGTSYRDRTPLRPLVLLARDGRKV